MDDRSLIHLVDLTLGRAWRRSSPWHGEEHWRCVTETGLELTNGLDVGDRLLVFCFGLLHDTRRENETVDPEHGLRAERFAHELVDGGGLVLDEGQLERLAGALRLHSDGLVSGDPVTGACWDADRLHLPRVGIEPDPARLSTTAALEPGALSRAAELRDEGAAHWETLVARIHAHGADAP